MGTNLRIGETSAVRLCESGDRDAARALVERYCGSAGAPRTITDMVARIPRLAGTLTPIGFNALCDAWDAWHVVPDLSDVPQVVV